MPPAALATQGQAQQHGFAQTVGAVLAVRRQQEEIGIQVSLPHGGGIQRAGVLHMVRQPQAADQLFAPGLVGEHPVNHRAQQRPFVQRGPARHPQHRAGVLRQHGGQRFEHGMQVFERVVALAEQQHRRFAKGAGCHTGGV